MTLNVTSGNHTDCHPGPEAFLPALYLILFPVALVLNSVAAWVSLNVRSTSTFMTYLKSLLWSDIVETLAIPLEVFHELNTSSVPYHAFYCRYLSPIRYICMYVSITLMALISVDRYFKIVQPGGGQMFCQNLLFARVVSASVWVTLIATTGLPTMILTDRSPNVSDTLGSCMLYKGPPGVSLHAAINVVLNLYFWLVCVLVVVCYLLIGRTVVQSFRNSGSSNSQAKQKTTLRVFLVLAVFLVSFGPYHVVRIPYTFQQTQNVVFCRDVLSVYAKELGLWFATVNVCLDPIVYFFLCREFNEKLTSVVEDARRVCRRSGAAEQT